MLSSLQQAVIQPASFFEGEARDPGLRQPAIVVLIVALFGLLSVIPVFQATLSALPPGASMFAAVGVIIGAIGGLFGPFIIWLVYTTLFYLLSLVFGGEGEFRDLFAVIGWGFAPRALSSLVGAVVLFVAFSGMNVSDPAQVQQFQQSFSRSPLGLVSQGISIFVSLWSAWIWTHAVANTRDLTTRQAGIVVGVIVGLSILAGLGTTFLL